MTGGHASLRPSIEFVALDGCCAPALGHAHGTCSQGGGNNGADLMFADFHRPWLGDFKAIRIPSIKLVCVNQLVGGTSAKTWVHGCVLENYTCLSFGRDLYDAEFGVSYGRQTVLVSNCEPMCNGEEHLHHSKVLLEPSIEGALEGYGHGHGLCGV